MFANFTTKEILNNHRERCLLINKTQAVKYETGIIKFKNHNKQKPIPFKIYADSECLVKRTNIPLSQYTKLYQKEIPNSVGAKLVCIDNKFTSLTKIFTGSNCNKEFIEWIFNNKSIVMKASIKNLIKNVECLQKIKIIIEIQDCCIWNPKIKN